MTENERLEFIKNSLPNLKINDVHVNNSGWDNDITIINQSLVFRFPKYKKIAERVRREVILVDSLKKMQPNIEIPEYRLLYDASKNLICVFYQYINGVSLNELDRIPNRNENAKLLGDFLTKLHRLKNTPELQTNHTYDFWKQLYTSVKREVFPFLNEFQRGEIRETFIEFLAGYSVDSLSKTVIHGDLSASNIIFDRDSERISGVIDFTDAQIGDPAYDFAGFYWNFGPEFTKEVLSYYSGIETSAALFNRVKHFYGIQPIFHELLHAVHEGHYVDWENAFTNFLVLKKS